MSDKIKLGLVGTQAWGWMTGRAMAKSDVVDLAWVYDIDPKATEKAAQNWNAKPARSLDELLSSDIAGVVIMTPNHTHLSIGRTVAAAGKHLSVAKPITNTIADAQQLIDAFDKAGLFLATNHQSRKSARAQLIKQHLDSGAFGTVMAVVGVTGHPGGMRHTDTWRALPHQAPGGPLIQLAVHTFDTWQYWFGPALEVQATGGHRATPGNNDDYYSGLVRWPNGLVASFTTQYAAPGCSFDAVYGTLQTVYKCDGDTTLIQPDPNKPGHTTHGPAPVESFDEIARDIDDFARDITAGRQPHASGQDGLLSLACVHAAICSNERGGAWVKVSEILGGG